MRTRKELICLNIKDLDTDEIQKLSDYELNCCDNCGDIDLSENLKWIDNEDFHNDEHCLTLLSSGISALCSKCFDKRKEKLARCLTCDTFFIIHTENIDCVHCNSREWIWYKINDSE